MQSISRTEWIRHRFDEDFPLQKYKYLTEDSNMSVPSEPSSPQSSPRSRSNSPDDILERVAADVKEYERENVDTFEASVKAKHNLMTVEQNNGKNRYYCYVVCSERINATKKRDKHFTS